MAIVLKYGNPGSILQSGFASGIGHRKNQQQEDLLRIWQQQTQQGFQAQQAEFSRNQQVGLQQQAQNFQADQQALSQGFQARGRALQIEQADLTRQQQQKHYDDLLYQGTQKALANGEKALPPSAQKELNKLEEGRVLLQGPGWTDEQRAQFQKDYEAKKRGLTMLAEPVTSPAAAANRDTTYRDQTGKAYDQPIEGVTTPYSVSSGKAIENPQAVAAQKAAEAQAKQTEKTQAAEEKRQEKARADAAKQAEKAQAESANYSKTLHAEMVRRQTANAVKDVEGNVTTKPLESYAEEAKKGLAAAGIVPPQQAAPPEQAGVTRGQYGDGQNGEPVTSQQAPERDPGYSQHEASQLPPGAIVRPDGMVEYNGKLYRRRTQ